MTHRSGHHFEGLEGLAYVVGGLAILLVVLQPLLMTGR